MVTLAIALSSVALSVQEAPPLLRSRTVTLTLPLEPNDRPTSATLYASRDGGRTWSAAPSDRFRWRIEAQRLILTYDAPEDGTYGFRWQFQDDLGNFCEETIPGQPPWKEAWIDTTPPSLEVLSPGEVYTNARSTRVDYKADDPGGVEAVTAWVSPDGGRSWGAASARQGRDERGEFFELTFPADGVYRVMLHARDRAENQTPGAPEEFADFSPHLVVRARTAPPAAVVDGAPEIRADRSPVRVTVRFPGLFPGELDTVLAWLSRDGTGMWTAASPAVTLGEDGCVAEIPLPEPGRFGVVLGFRDPAGFEWRAPTEGTAPDAWIIWEAPTPPPALSQAPPEATEPTAETSPLAPPQMAAPPLRWIAPRPGESFAVGQSIVLAWDGSGTAADGSVTLEFRQEEGAWVAVAQGRPTAGVEVWTVPGPANGAVEFRAWGRTAGGAATEPVSLGPFSVRATARPEVAVARHHYEHAVLALAQEEWTGALASLTLALRAWPDYPDALRSLGLLHLRQGRPAEAMPYLLRARAAMRSDPEAYLNVAAALRRLGLLDEACKELDDGLAIRVPADRWLLARFEQELLDLGDEFAAAMEPEKAAWAWRAILLLPPVHPALHSAAQARLAPAPRLPESRASR